MPRTIELGDDVKVPDGHKVRLQRGIRKGQSFIDVDGKVAVAVYDGYVGLYLALEPIPPRYVPFEKHELVEKLLGKTIKHKSGSVGIVHTVCDDGICVCGSWRVLGELLAEFTFLDGAPCGKLVE